MLHLALLSTALLAFPQPQPTSGHGKLTWFEGTYEELLAEAEKSQKPIFLEFFTQHCAACRLMAGSTFSDPAVVEIMEGFLCFAADGEKEGLQELSQQLGVRVFPGLLFLDSKGTPVDKFEGYHSPRTFLREVQRIQRNEETIPGLRARVGAEPTDVFAWLELAYKLIYFADQQGANQAYSHARALINSQTGYDPNDVEHLFRIGKRLRNLGDNQGYQAQIAAIQALDPEGKSRPMRRLAFDKASEHAKTTMDDTDLIRVMTGETDREMLHEGWNRISGCANFRSQRAKLRRKLEEADDHQATRRRALRVAFDYGSEDDQLEYGIMVIDVHLEVIDKLTDDEKTQLLKVANRIGELGENDSECLDRKACCLMLVGKQAEAIALAKRCMELEPTRLSWRKRLANFEAGKID